MCSNAARSNVVRSVIVTALMVALSGALAVPASAQVNSTVLGTVQDEQGGVLPGATIVLISDTRGIETAPVVTNSTGDFVLPNVTPDTYTLRVEMPSFRPYQRPGLRVEAQSRITLGTIRLLVGGAVEVVDVTAEAPLIQAASGERSFTLDTTDVENLPIGNRNFTSLATLAPGVGGTGFANVTRIGGGGDTNVVMDGVSTSSPGNNAIMLRTNPESLAEVRVITSGYQAEYGRQSGLQITAITKSGSNRFHGTVYDVERHSDWNSNSRQNILNGDPKPVSKERDWGFSIGGPVGRPGGDNKLFFFYAQEFEPRDAGGNVVRYRMPTELERMGNFSQSLDNNGNLYPFIKNPSSPSPCNAGNTAGCYADGGVLGKIPASTLYGPGMALLNMYPMPNIPNVPAGQSYNFELTRPTEEATGWQPVVKVDYQPTSTLRSTYRLAMAGQRADQVFAGTLPGFNDTRMARPIIATHMVSVNYTVSPTVFLEASYGRTDNELSGCALGGGASPGPTFCTNGFPVSELANAANAGIDGIPLIFPDARTVNPDFYTFGALNRIDPPMWDGTRVLLPPSFQWGGRVANAPPNFGLTSFYNRSFVHDFSASVTLVAGRHTIKAGIFNLLQYQSQISGGGGGAIGTLSFAQTQPGLNPFDTSFGYANAATGAFSSYSQASRFVEYTAAMRNTDFYVQDNWKVSDQLTLDYGVRFVQQIPDHDRFGNAAQFRPGLWDASAAPALYVPGCANGIYPCAGSNRQAMNLITGDFLGPNSAAAIGTRVPGTGDPLNGIRQVGDGIPEYGYDWPAIAVAPRFGMAYDVTGTQSLVVRGGIGLFFDRTAANATRASGTNPPISENVTLRFGTLQDLGTAGLAIEGAPNLGGNWEAEPDGLPASTQWNAGVQISLPFSAVLDVSYVGQHEFNVAENAAINAVDFGAAFLPENQDPTRPANATPGATALSTDLLRPIRGYGNISQQQQVAWRTFHSLQFSFNRRFSNGLSFGFNDTWSLYDHQSTNLRFDHTPDGRAVLRADQTQADELLGTTLGTVHVMRATAVWDLPDLQWGGGAKNIAAAIVNDWQVSGVWRGSTGGAYAVGFNYQSGGGNVNLTGSPNYGARVLVVGDPGGGCGDDVHRQFNTSAFAGPAPGSVGLESGTGYLRGCFVSALDLSIRRTLRLGGGRTIQLRADLFNAPNAAGITGRNTTMSLQNPLSPTTIRNLPFDEDGNLIDARSRPRGAGFGVANNYQSPRAVQLQARFTF